MLLSVGVQGLALSVRLGLHSMGFGLYNNSRVCTLCSPMIDKKELLYHQMVKLWMLWLRIHTKVG